MATRSRSSVPRASRGAPVVAAIFAATFEELAAVGYHALSLEAVAARAQVNRTTVYRRWPTTAALVLAAFATVREQVVPPSPSTGALRGDLAGFVIETARHGTTPVGWAALRMFLFEAMAPELAPLRATLASDWAAHGPPMIVDRAIARGELPVGTDPRFLIEAVHGATLRRMLVDRRPIDRRWAEALVDTLLRGVLTAPPPPARPARPSSRRDRTPARSR